MQIFDLKTMQQCDIADSTIVALGTFDGCHTGHMSVFRNAFLKAKSLNLKSVAYTFSSLPKKEAKCILTLDEKIKHIKKCGIDYIAIEDFENVRHLSGEEFVNQILINRLNAKGVSCGFNYRFGKNASCTCSDLQEILGKAGGSVEICQEIMHKGELVSSTRIRQLIENGMVEEILPFSAPYTVYAKVLEGKRLGRTIGIPTINQEIPKEKITPKRGVYITECEIGEDVYPAITNVGTRPTVENSDKENMETHIIGYGGILYSSFVRVNFYKRVRDEIKFGSLEELKNQISLDIEEAKKYFK